MLALAIARVSVTRQFRVLDGEAFHLESTFLNQLIDDLSHFASMSIEHHDI